MAKKGNRQIVVLKNHETGSLIYTRKNIKNTLDKIKLRKFDKKSRAHAVFEEVKHKLS